MMNLITSVITFFSGFLGALLAIFVIVHVEKARRIKILMELQKEFLLKLDTEMTFAQMAAQLKKEMGDEIG
ncbi:MAG: hypothetical protein ACR2IQ_00870 [Minisyncoccia bacterium]